MSGLNRPTAAEYEALRVRARDVWTFLRTCDVEGYDRTRECPEFRVLFEPLPAGDAGRAFLDYGRLIALHRALVALGRESRMRRAALGDDCGFQNASAWDVGCEGFAEPQRRVVSNEAWMNQAGAWLTLAESWVEEGCPEKCQDERGCGDVPDFLSLSGFHWVSRGYDDLACGTKTSHYILRQIGSVEIERTEGCDWPGYIPEDKLEESFDGGATFAPYLGGDISFLATLNPAGTTTVTTDYGSFPDGAITIAGGPEGGYFYDSGCYDEVGGGTTGQRNNGGWVIS